MVPACLLALRRANAPVPAFPSPLAVFPLRKTLAPGPDFRQILHRRVRIGSKPFEKTHLCNLHQIGGKLVSNGLEFGRGDRARQQFLVRVEIEVQGFRRYDVFARDAEATRVICPPLGIVVARTLAVSECKDAFVRPFDFSLRPFLGLQDLEAKFGLSGSN